MDGNSHQDKDFDTKQDKDSSSNDTKPVDTLQYSIKGRAVCSETEREEE